MKPSPEIITWTPYIERRCRAFFAEPFEEKSRFNAACPGGAGYSVALLDGIGGRLPREEFTVNRVNHTIKQAQRYCSPTAFWRDGRRGIGEFLDDVFSTVDQIAEEVSIAISLGCDLERKYLKSRISGGASELRVSCYPVAGEGTQPISLNSYRNVGLLAVILGAPMTSNIQICDPRTKEFECLELTDETMLFAVGELLEYMTCGYLKAPVCRASISTEGDDGPVNAIYSVIGNNRFKIERLFPHLKNRFPDYSDYTALRFAEARAADASDQYDLSDT